MIRLVLRAAAVAALLMVVAPVAAQTPPTSEVPVHTVILDYDTNPAGTPDGYVIELDRALADLAASSGLPPPASVRHELYGLAVDTIPPVLPARPDDVVTLGFSVGAGRLGEPGVADQEGRSITTRADCEAEFPEDRVIAFRTLSIGARTGYQCLRERRVGPSLKLMSLAWIELGDRRVATASQFGVIGTDAEIERIFAHARTPAMRLFEAQADAVFVRLAPAP